MTTKLSTVLVSLLIVCLARSGLASGKGFSATYDVVTDRLTVIVQNQPARDVLASISKKTGISILADPSVDLGSMSIVLRDQPLDVGLGRVLKNFNHVLVYRAGKDGRRIQLVKILPQGKEDSGNLIPISSISSNNADDDMAYQHGTYPESFTKTHRKAQNKSPSSKSASGQPERMNGSPVSGQEFMPGPSSVGGGGRPPDASNPVPAAPHSESSESAYGPLLGGQ